MNSLGRLRPFIMCTDPFCLLDFTLKPQEVPANWIIKIGNKLFCFNARNVQLYIPLNLELVFLEFVKPTNKLTEIQG